jgi:hypothetical protein
MEFEKDGLPPYEYAVEVPRWRKRGGRRSRALRFWTLLLALIIFVVFAEWNEIPGWKKGTRTAGISLSIEKLEADLATCSKLRTKPTDPIGVGRERNARYIDGNKPTLIKNATVWTGEPVKSTSAKDSHTGIGYSWITADVFLEFGLIKAVGEHLDLSAFSSDYLVWDAKGRQLTTGIIDMHSQYVIFSYKNLQKEGSGELFREHTLACLLPKPLLASLLPMIIEILLC